MPAIGTRHRTDNLLVTTKIHGPTTTFMFDPKDILSAVKAIADGDNPPPAKEAATRITRSVMELVKHDPNVVWVDCEVLRHDGILFTDALAIEDLI